MAAWLTVLEKGRKIKIVCYRELGKKKKMTEKWLKDLRKLTETTKKTGFVREMWLN